jgi:hypothetical protein
MARLRPTSANAQLAVEKKGRDYLDPWTMESARVPQSAVKRRSRPCLNDPENHGLSRLEDSMRKFGIALSLAALATIGACSRGNDARPDDALKNDLALAAQAQPYQAQQFVSPAEQQYGANGQPLPYTGVTRAPAMRAPAPVYRAPARRTASSSSSRSSGGYSYPAPERKVIKHTGRDAAIGAGAGAIIGAVSSRDKLKGGLIGAAAGGILGAVIGNNVDIQRP